MKLLTVFLLLLMSQTYCLAQEAERPCSIDSSAFALKKDAGSLFTGVRSVPRNSIRPRNLDWEIPLGIATGVLIAEADRPAEDRIHSLDLTATSGRWSNVGLGIELATGAFAWAGGCLKHKDSLARTGFVALEGMGAAGTMDLALKLAFDRQFPYTRNSTGKFWGGGRSFPSGHAATSFAFASVIAHRYPKNPWIKWGAYALATGVSVSRYPAKKHFPSDILVGGALGYVTGTYLADHAFLHD